MLLADAILLFCAVIAITDACTTSSPSDSSRALKVQAKPTQATTTSEAATASSTADDTATTTVMTTTANSTVVVSAQFADFAKTFGKSYGANEAIRRQAVFTSRHNYINQHNANSKKSFQMGTNQFSDWMDSEVDAMLPKIPMFPASVSPGVANFDTISNVSSNNFSTTPAISSNNTSTISTTVVTTKSPALNSSTCAKDWRLCGAVTPVKDQGGCGSCWSFSATGALESRWFIKHGNLPTLSEEFLIDCFKKDCGGTNAANAYVWMYKTKSYATTQAAYPYTAILGSSSSCKFSTAMPNAASIAYPAWAKVTSTATVSMESAIINALQSGPVNIAINVQSDATGNKPFMAYKRGVFSQANCSTSSLNHQMLLVGYGTDPVDGNYWIVKNSWKTAWGINGYLWIKRGVNMCGIESFITYPIVA